MQSKLENTALFFQSAQESSERVETHLQECAEAVEPPSLTSSSWLDEHISTLQTAHRFHTTLTTNRNLMDYVKNGACIGYFARFDAMKLHLDKKMKYLQMGAELDVGHAQVSVDAQAKLYKDGKLSPSLILEGSVDAAIAQAGAYVNVGNSYVQARGEATVKVGCASAEAKAIISKDEITMKAKAGAAAVRGEVKGTLSIFGVKITASASGSIGAVGAEAEFSSKKGEFEVGTSVSLFAGLGIKIRVNY